MTMLVQAILASREETRWMAYLMGTGSTPYGSKAVEVPDSVDGISKETVPQ